MLHKPTRPPWAAACVSTKVSRPMLINRDCPNWAECRYDGMISFSGSEQKSARSGEETKLRQVSSAPLVLGLADILGLLVTMEATPVGIKDALSRAKRTHMATPALQETDCRRRSDEAEAPTPDRTTADYIYRTT